MSFSELTTTIPNSSDMPLFYGEYDAYTQGSSFVQIANLDTESVRAFQKVEPSLEEIDIAWANIAKLSRERWSKENPY
ncbi:hypothetical protein ES703_99355 [subsurface metagenome]